MNRIEFEKENIKGKSHINFLNECEMKGYNIEDLKNKILVGNQYDITFRNANNEDINEIFQLSIICDFKIGRTTFLKEWIENNFDNGNSIAKVNIIIDLTYSAPAEDINHKYIESDLNSAYKDYYKTYKLLVEKHINLNFGRGTGIAVNFTEGLCRLINNLEIAKTKEYDAIDNDQKKYEIKSTIYEQGNVSINKDSNYDYLFWMYFNIEKNTMTLSRFTHDQIIEYIKSNKSHLTAQRITISLEKLPRDNNAKKILLEDSFWTNPQKEKY
jgi:hypothetical protein